MGKTVALDKVRSILSLRTKGYSYREISHKLDIPKSTVADIARRNQDPKHPTPGKKRGPKSTLKPQLKRSLDHYVTQNHSATLHDISQFLKEKHGVTLHRTQISKWRRDSGWKAVSGFKKPILTEFHKKSRLEWFQRYLTDDFRNVFFSDEKSFSLNSQRRKLWKKPGEKMPAKSSGKYGRSVKVWAAISKHGKAEIYLYSKKFNSRTYVECLEENLIPVADTLYPSGWRFLQDNDGPHISKYTKENLEKYEIEILDHTANSPDLNPMEKIWGIMDARVSAAAPRTIAQLKKTILLAWENLSQKIISDTIESLKIVMEEIIRSNGDFVDKSNYIRYSRS